MRAEQQAAASLRQRIQASRGLVRRMGVDYLAYALLDSVVDQYFVVLEDIGEALEDMEDALLEKPGPECLEALHELRKHVMTVRRAAWPIRDMLNAVLRGESELFDPGTLPDPRDPENLLKVSGRGVLIMKTFMDEVSFNAQGNQVTLIKLGAPIAAER